MQKIQKYYSSPRISQSALKDLAYHPLYYKAKHIDKKLSEEYGDEAEHFLIGSLAECILLTPEYIEQMYAIRTFELSPQIRKFVDYIVKNKIDYSNYDILFDIGKSLSLFGNIKSIDTFKNTLEKEKFEEAVYFYEQNSGKSIVTEELYNKAAEISNSFLHSPLTTQYFTQGPNVEILTSLDIYWFYEKVACKSLLDFVHINHSNRTIAINDLKTTRTHVSDFISTVIKYRYDIQAAFYMDAFKWWVQNIRTDLADYEILGFSFFVESTNNIGSPLIYHVPKSTIYIGKYGADIINNGVKKTLIGFDELITNFKWHMENNTWSYTKKQYENKGIIDINIETC